MPDFTRRHYEAIADVLAAQRTVAYATASHPEQACETLADVATAFADLFERDNDNFNRRRFFLAADCEDQK